MILVSKWVILPETTFTSKMIVFDESLLYSFLCVLSYLVNAVYLGNFFDSVVESGEVVESLK